MCDGAPDVTGLHDIDEFIQAQVKYAGNKILGVIPWNCHKFKIGIRETK